MDKGKRRKKFMYAAKKGKKIEGSWRGGGGGAEYLYKFSLSEDVECWQKWNRAKWRIEVSICKQKRNLGKVALRI